MVALLSLATVNVWTESLHVKLGNIDFADDVRDAGSSQSPSMQVNGRYFSVEIDGEAICVDYATSFTRLYWCILFFLDPVVKDFLS